MQRGVPQIEAAMFNLSKDGELIKSTVDLHKTELKNALSSTKKHLSAVKRAEAWERYTLNAALFFFFSVVFYIVCKRTRLLSILYFIIKNLISIYFYSTSLSNTSSQQQNIIHDINSITSHNYNEDIIPVDDECVSTINYNDVVEVNAFVVNEL
jgi:hypothetical protein